MAKQRLSVVVPFSGSALQLGDSVGGPGASLVTAKAVLLDAVGVMDVQSKGHFTGQTNAGMLMLSGSDQKVHSGGKVEIFAGGGNDPGDCAAGAPAGAPDSGKPGAVAELAANTACAGLSGVKAWQDLSSAVTAAAEPAKNMAEAASASMAVIKGLTDLGKAATGPFATEKPASTMGGALEGLGGVAGIVGGLAKQDFGAVASGVSSLVSGSAAVAGGGGADLEERATGSIKMIAGKKITGLAPLGIDFKTPGKFQVKALLVTDFTTVTFSNYALAKFEVKSLYQIKTTSLKFEVDSKSAVKVDTEKFTGKSKFITQDGVTHVKKTLLVTGDVSLVDTLTVYKDVTLKGKLTVKGEAHIHGKVTVEQDVTVKSNLSSNKKVKTKDIVAKSRVTFLPG
jgi:cytoskeletal protein CcmA (bactofilin family)